MLKSQGEGGAGPQGTCPSPGYAWARPWAARPHPARRLGSRLASGTWEGGRRSQLPGWETEGRFPVTSSLPPCLISGAATAPDPVGRPWAEPLPCLLSPQQQHPSLLRSAGNCPLQIPALPSLPGLVCGLGSQVRALGRKGQPGPEATDALPWSPLQQAGHVHVAWSPGGCRTRAPSLACRFWWQRPWWRGACGQGCHLLPCVDLISHPLGNSPGRGTGGQPVCSPPPALPQRPPGAGPAWGGRRRSGGEGAAALFPELAFPGGAGEHTVPIRSPVLCCMCFHGFRGEEWGGEIPVSPAAARA